MTLRNRTWKLQKPVKLWKHQIHQTLQQDVHLTEQKVPLLVETSPWPIQPVVISVIRLTYSTE